MDFSPPLTNIIREDVVVLLYLALASRVTGHCSLVAFYGEKTTFPFGIHKRTSEGPGWVIVVGNLCLDP